MAITVTRKQITNLAKSLDIEGQGYLNKLDTIAKAFGYQTQAALMTALNAPEPADEPRLELRAKIRDWRAPGDLEPDEEPILAPIDAVARDDGAAFELFLNGAEKNPYEPGATSICLERHGAMTRVLVWDGICDAPFVLGLPDSAPLRLLPSDWEHIEPEGGTPDPAP